jgi:hypothetical protein
MKIVSIIFIILIFQFIQGCDDYFNPYTNFKQDYGIACVLRSDTTLQLATVIKSYLIEDDNSVDPKLLFVEGADVRLWHGDSVYRLRDTTLLSSDSNDSIKCYYTNRFKIENNKNIEIEVLLSNGKRLKGISKTPTEIEFEDYSDVIIPPSSKNNIQVIWSIAGINHYYTSQLKIKCEYTNQGITETFYKILPNKLFIENNITKAAYPRLSKNNYVTYDIEAIDWYLQKLADSVSNISQLKIHQKLELDVITFDTEVSRYISTSLNQTNSLSIRFDENEYSNILGGYGIFGSQITKSYDKLKFYAPYIISYNFGFINDGQ